MWHHDNALIIIRSFSQVLTDLCEAWHALWVDGLELLQTICATKESAVEFVNDLLAGRSEACRGGLGAKAAQRSEIDL